MIKIWWVQSFCLLNLDSLMYISCNVIECKAIEMVTKLNLTTNSWGPSGALFPKPAFH